MRHFLSIAPVSSWVCQRWLINVHIDTTSVEAITCPAFITWYFSDTFLCIKIIYLFDIICSFRVVQHIDIVISFMIFLTLVGVGSREWAVVVNAEGGYLNYFQTFSFLYETIVNLFVQTVFLSFEFSWRLFPKVELLGQYKHFYSTY